MRSLSVVFWVVLAGSGATSASPLAAQQGTAAQSTAARATIGGVDRADPRLDAIVPVDAVLEVVSDGHLWVEGPLWVPALGGVLFSDTRTNAVYLWREGSGTVVWLTPSGYTGATPRGGEPGSNGLALDLDGRLLLAQHGDRRIARLDAPFSAPEPRFQTVADRHEGRRFNSPNDLALRANGDIYFTDPPYGLEGNVSDPVRETEVFGVYRRRPDGTVDLMVENIERPNGIVFSPDQRVLYVSTSGGMPAVRAYDVAADGSLSGERVHFAARGDGMTVDQTGNLYIGGLGPSVTVVAPDGTRLGAFQTGDRSANATFGEDGYTLFLASGSRLLRVRLTAKGVGF